MKRGIYRIFRSASAAVGFALLYGAVSTSDFYILELRQAEPDSVNTMLIWGAVLMLPWLLHKARELWKERVK